MQLGIITLSKAAAEVLHRLYMNGPQSTADGLNANGVKEAVNTGLLTVGNGGETLYRITALGTVLFYLHNNAPNNQLFLELFKWQENATLLEVLHNLHIDLGINDRLNVYAKLQWWCVHFARLVKLDIAHLDTINGVFGFKLRIENELLVLDGFPRSIVTAI